MNTSTYIIIYLSICAVITTVIPAARNQWKVFFESIPQNYKNIDYEAIRGSILGKKVKYPNLKKWKNKVVLTLIFGIFIILLFVLTPLLLPLVIKDEKKRIQHEKSRIELKANLNEEVDTNLYFDRMNGVGYVTCLDCDYSERILCFIDSFNLQGQPSNGRLGLQCQSCGKFHIVKSRRRTDKPSLCDCGGVLEIEKPVFCPKCKSKNMKYKVQYVT